MHAKVNEKLPVSISTTAVEVKIQIFSTSALVDGGVSLYNTFQNIFSYDKCLMSYARDERIKARRSS
jgi:hypothetical protein